MWPALGGERLEVLAALTMITVIVIDRLEI
jgi:hypothetical protein